MKNERNEVLEQLYEEHYDSVFRLCASIVRNDSKLYPLIEDCVQDAFIKAINHYDEFKDYKNPMGWICVAATNRLKSELRKETNRRKTVFPLVLEECESTAFSNNNVEEMLDKEDIIQRISDIYEMLTEHEKAIFEEYFINGKKMQKVAEDTGFSLNSVRSAVNRIRKRARSIKNLSIFFVLKCFFHH